ncbi:hypothetical protein [Rickettsiales endosymbiont of Stachyamoeba lipophora]|uniref:hypothetical protein n=1 Tax=Rickettsiales endosymbiont of Stachyamoeba lipophora TaxID=2486578 RepID=UPI000F650E1F|nr:hypothetical protein [Rickettsiales endosymbiont of Stachyamoeba lipophora]AZL15329.1 hypothetical protein EF513_01995 [Rickettsiales endosymbiont of Stachyamoeba lipophora]
MTFIKSYTTSLGDLIYLIKGKNQGVDAWHYVLVNKVKLPIFLKKITESSLDASLYGSILYSGWGTNPPARIANLIKEKYQ